MSTSVNDMPADIVEAADRAMNEAGSILDGVTIEQAMSESVRIRNIYRDSIASAILAEREKAAVLAETVDLPKSYSTNHMKLACKVAARAIRRGRHLTSAEKAANIQRWLDSVEEDA